MLTQNPFLQLTLPRAIKALSRVESLIWTEVSPVECAFGGSFREPILFDKAKRLKFQPIKLPFHWGQAFDQGWFRLTLPARKEREPLYLHWNDQGEGTAYIEGVPYYGFDVAHRYCAIPQEVSQIHMESLCLQSAIWHPRATGLNDPKGSFLSAASLMRRNSLAWEVFHDLQVLFDLAIEEGKSNDPAHPPKTSGVGYRAPIDNVTVLYRRLLRSLDDAVNALDQGGLKAMKASLGEAYRTFAGQNERIKAVLTGHAHIDLVWLWPERSSEFKAVHTFSTMDRLMDLYPEFVFGYSQPASYDAVGRISPGLMKRVSQRIRKGRWEPVGATEVESDTLMACGEALARSFLLGQDGYRKIQGRPSPVLWIPDVFGYCASLPQIMLQTGVDYFFTTKLTWSNINRFPYSSFIWRGNDGSEVLVHVTQENGYNQVVSSEELRRGARAYRQSDVHDEFLAPTGYGDGGGGVTEEMCERARRVQSLAGLPEVGWGRVEDFFKRLDTKRDKLPKYQGELYLEYHRGVLTTHGDLKADFRATERALQTWEAVRCSTSGKPISKDVWRRLVFAQFHDYIPGSSIWEVYEEGLAELKAITGNALASSSRELARKSGKSGLFNPLPVERIALTHNGKSAVRLGPLSGGPESDLPVVDMRVGVTASPRSLKSGLVSAKFDARGQISALSFEGGTIPVRGPLGAMVVYPDFPHQFEAWDIDLQTLALGKVVESSATVTVKDNGPLEKTVEFSRKIGSRSEMIVRYRLDAFQPVLQIEYEINWQEEQTLLQVIFPTAFDGRMARFGAPFGSVLRSQQAGPPRDEAMFEGAASRWAIVSDDSESAGLAVLSEAKYGFSCREGTLGVSLIRSPRVTGEDPDHRRLFPVSLRRGGARPSFSDQGTHTIKLALAYHRTGLPRVHLAPMLAETLFTPSIACTTPEIDAGFLGIEGGESLIPCWAKPADDEDGWILRLHETFGHRGKAKLKLREGFKAFRLTLAENGTGTPVKGALDFSPYELISIRITRVK